MEAAFKIYLAQKSFLNGHDASDRFVCDLIDVWIHIGVLLHPSVVYRQCDLIFISCP